MSKYLFSLLGMGVEGEDWFPQIIGYRPFCETMGLDLEEQKRVSSVVSLPAFLAGVACALVGSACWSLEQG